MCQLTCHLAAKCRHPIRYEYNHCAQAPYPSRCPELVDSVDASVLDDNKPFCDPCYKRMEVELTDEFRQKRLRLTAKARAENRSVDEISEMRRTLMIEHYERLKRANKQLPAAGTEVSFSSRTSETSVNLDEDEDGDEAAEIREQLKDWSYKKLDYLHKPFPVEPPPSPFYEGNAAWLERDDSGVQLRISRAPRQYEVVLNLLPAIYIPVIRPLICESHDNITPTMGKPPNLYAFGDIDSLAKSLRKYVLQCQSAGLERHDAFKVAVSGGSLPNTLAKALLTPGDTDGVANFSKWEIFFADERAVPLDHEDSNYRLLKDELLDKIPSSLGEPTVHPIDVQYMDDVQEMADQYQDALMKSFAAKDSVKTPIFDLLLLGCGPDGHTCSLFPGHELLRESDAWVAAIEDSPKPPAKRITLTLPVVTHGIKIAFVATGDGKRKILKEILDTEEGRSLPCGLVNEAGADKVSWFTDTGAVEGVGFPRRGSL